MYHSYLNLRDMDVHALDGEAGRISDIYFDSLLWRIRYFVVDAGNWLSRRKVLVTPQAVQPIGADDNGLHIDLTRKHIAESPPMDEARPVSREYEIALHEFFNWPPYWMVDELNFPILAYGGDLQREQVLKRIQKRRAEEAEDTHLRSMEEVRGYHIEDSDDEKNGYIYDFLIAEHGWNIAELVINARKWLPGRKITLSPFHIEQVRWADSAVRFDLDTAAIDNRPDYEPEKWLAESAD